MREADKNNLVRFFPRQRHYLLTCHGASGCSSPASLITLPNAVITGRRSSSPTKTACCTSRCLARRTTANHSRILGYCLMSNHVHLVAVPERADSLARTLQCAHSEYAAEWNRSQRRSGRVWQGRYFSCPLDPVHLFTALRYVDLNPVRARLVDAAGQYDCSSAHTHVNPSCHDALLGFDRVDWFGEWDYSGWKRSRWEMTRTWMENGKCCGVLR